MKLLGIDPGYGRIGYGVIEGSRSSFKVLEFGCIKTDANTSLIERIQELHQKVLGVVQKHAPDRAAVERLFFSKNQKTALDVSQARGAILLTLSQMNVPIFEYTPMQVKSAVAGDGSADKLQVQKMVMMQLGLKGDRMQDDAADALAVALTLGVVER